MGKRRRRREPHWHWLLLCLAMPLLLGELWLDGYATEEAPGTPATRGSAPSAPAAGPAFRAATDGSVTSRAMPAKTIALTFEDGPDPVWTPRILAVLARHHAHATFFQLGSRVNRYPAISQEIIAQGSEVGSHGFTHADLSAAGDLRRDLELTLASNAITGATGRRPVLLRPAHSSTPAAVTAADRDVWRQAGTAGYLTVLADRDTADWRQPGVAAIVAAARPAAGAGAVVSMHDAGGDRTQTVAALDLLIPQSQAAGYRFVTVSQALRLTGPPAAAAGQRWRGHGLRFAQSTGAWLTDALIVFTVTMLIVGVLRSLIQLYGSLRHHRHGQRHGASYPYGYPRHLHTGATAFAPPTRRIPSQAPGPGASFPTTPPVRA